MQTFLPYANYVASAAAIDSKRLQKQAVETYQILLQLVELKPVKEHDGKNASTVGFEDRPRTGGWKNHPMIRMWRGHELSLARYQLACCTELRSRPTASGRPRSVQGDKMVNWALAHALLFRDSEFNPADPEWVGRADLHASHRAALLWKADNATVRGRPTNAYRDWYAQFNWTEPHEYSYVWPIAEEGT